MGLNHDACLLQGGLSHPWGKGQATTWQTNARSRSRAARGTYGSPVTGPTENGAGLPVGRSTTRGRAPEEGSPRARAGRVTASRRAGRAVGARAGFHRGSVLADRAPSAALPGETVAGKPPGPGR